MQRAMFSNVLVRANNISLYLEIHNRVIPHISRSFRNTEDVFGKPLSYVRKTHPTILGHLKWTRTVNMNIIPDAHVW